MMEFYQSGGGRLGLRNIPPVLAELLRRIPEFAVELPEAVEERFFPPPSENPNEEGLCHDWKAHVQPELHEAFLSARQVVEADLRGLAESDGTLSLEFPLKHADAWINALNQARLGLAAQYQLDEQDLSRPARAEILTERELAALRIHFYAALQQWLVEVIDP